MAHPPTNIAHPHLLPACHGCRVLPRLPTTRTLRRWQRAWKKGTSSQAGKHDTFGEFSGYFCAMMGCSHFRQSRKKWTFARPTTSAASGRRVFEANVNRFVLILQVHGAKPLNDLVQQASIRKR